MTVDNIDLEYKKYSAESSVLRCKLKVLLQEANALRKQAHLPLRDVDKIVAEKYPTQTKEQYIAEKQEKAQFDAFFDAEVSNHCFSEPSAEMNWQASRARAYTRLHVQRKIEQKWEILKRKAY